MRILLSIKAILNYLYNHLIDLIWTKKIRFADGSEMTTVPNGNNLYDIKILSQAIADKGFAFMCHTTTRNLSKSKVPTLYNDILSKYNNSDKVYTGVIDYSNSKIIFDSYDNKTYWWSFDTLNYSSNLDLSSPQTLTLSEVDYFENVLLGQNINIITNYRNHKFFIYDKSWNYINTINFTQYDFVDILFARVINGYIIFGFGTVDFVNNRCLILKFDDNTTVNYQLSDNYDNYLGMFDGYLKPYKVSNVYNGNIYVTCLAGNNSWTCYLLKININNLNKFEIINTGLTDGTVVTDGINLSEVVKFYDNYYLSYTNKIYKNANADLTNWSIIKNTSSFNYCLYQAERTFYIVGNDYILKTTNFSDFETVLTFNSNNGYEFFFFFADNSTLIYSTKNQPLYVYSGLVLKVYTEYYTINGTLISINCYKFDDFKICISDNGGTNDTNIKIVYDYLGYCNYWLIDLTNETVCIQRDKNTYSAMFIGDDFIDDLNDLPTNDYSCVALKKYVDTLISQVGAVGITPYAISSLSTGTKNTVYGKTQKPTLVIFGEVPPAWEDDWNFYLKVSTDNNTWIDVAYWRVGSGDPSSSPMYNAIIGKGLYWKFTTSHGSYTLKYAPLY